jgi:hypothetical protein
MTLDQRLTANDLQAQGYTITTGPDGVVAKRGNDCRLVLADGSMRRAIGARR